MARLFFAAFMLLSSSACGGSPEQGQPEAKKPKLPWVRGSIGEDHRADLATVRTTVRAVLGREHLPFVAFANGTVVIFDTPNLPSSLEVAALKIMTSDGPIALDAPSAEFETVNLGDAHGWVVKWRHPQVMTFVRQDEVLPDAGDGAIAEFAREKRKRDAALLSMVHVEDAEGPRAPMTAKLQQHALSALEGVRSRPCDEPRVIDGELQLCAIVIGNRARDFFEHVSSLHPQDHSPESPSENGAHDKFFGYLALRMPPMDEVRTMLHLFAFDNGAAVGDVLDKETLANIGLVIVAEEGEKNVMSASARNLASLLAEGALNSTTTFLGGSNRAEQWRKITRKEPVYVDDYRREEIPVALKLTLKGVIANAERVASAAEQDGGVPFADDGGTRRLF